MERDTSWDNPQLSDGDTPSIKNQKEEILNMNELNDYLRMLADMKNIGIRRKLVLLEGFINKVRREIEHQNGGH